jgi:hypothetical protein
VRAHDPARLRDRARVRTSISMFLNCCLMPRSFIKSARVTSFKVATNARLARSRAVLSEQPCWSGQCGGQLPARSLALNTSLVSSREFSPSLFMYLLSRNA